jgi:phosphatidylglycerophosphatase A
MTSSDDTPPDGPRRGPLDRLSVAIATVCGVGYAPVAPGTFGTAVTVPMVWAASSLPQWGYVALCAAVTLVAIAASSGAERAFGDHDSGRIVVDEVAGYFWTMVAAPRGSLGALALGFVLFRVADIVKPPPARQIDRQMGGGAGVVLDDVAAGLWAALALWLLVRGGAVAWIDQLV